MTRELHAETREGLLTLCYGLQRPQTLKTEALSPVIVLGDRVFRWKSYEVMKDGSSSGSVAGLKEGARGSLYSYCLHNEHIEAFKSFVSIQYEGGHLSARSCSTLI